MLNKSLFYDISELVWVQHSFKSGAQPVEPVSWAEILSANP